MCVLTVSTIVINKDLLLYFGISFLQCERGILLSNFVTQQNIHRVKIFLHTISSFRSNMCNKLTVSKIILSRFNAQHEKCLSIDNYYSVHVDIVG